MKYPYQIDNWGKANKGINVLQIRLSMKITEKIKN